MKCGKEIVFDLNQIKEFIEDREDEHYGRCGEKYYTGYRLTDEGEIEHKNYNIFIDRIKDEWKKEGIKGEIIED